MRLPWLCFICPFAALRGLVWSGLVLGVVSGRSAADPLPAAPRPVVASFLTAVDPVPGPRPAAAVTISGSVGSAGPLGSAVPSSYLASVVAELEKAWPRNRTVNIVCHGHSVPAGYFKTPVVDSVNAYPAGLHQKLKVRFPLAVINVIVTAIGGENSVKGAARFERDVLSHRPDVVCIDYGLNDRASGLASARAAWVAMIESARAAGVKVILLSPTADTKARVEDPLDPLNQHAAQIRQLATDYRTGLVDSLGLFHAELRRGARLEDLMSHSNHPNARGHALVALALLDWFPVTVSAP